MVTVFAFLRRMERSKLPDLYCLYLNVKSDGQVNARESEHLVTLIQSRRASDWAQFWTYPRLLEQRLLSRLR